MNQTDVAIHKIEGLSNVLIDGFRYGFTDRFEGSLLGGGLFVLALSAVLTALVWRLFAVGYRLKT